MEATTNGYSVTYSVCKYRMPCGFCELKKEQCDMIGVPYVPHEPDKTYEPWKETPVTVYGCPSWEVTCKNETN